MVSYRVVSLLWKPSPSLFLDHNAKNFVLSMTQYDSKQRSRSLPKDKNHQGDWLKSQMFRLHPQSTKSDLAREEPRKLDTVQAPQVIAIISKFQKCLSKEEMLLSSVPSWRAASIKNVAGHSNQRRKRNKRNPNRKRRSKTVTVCRWYDTIHRES